jgi:hypothetical protein
MSWDGRRGMESLLSWLVRCNMAKRNHGRIAGHPLSAIAPDSLAGQLGQ